MSGVAARIGFVFVAPNVNLRNAALIRFGKGVTLERGVIIDGLSRDGIEFGDNVTIGPYSVVRAGMLTNLGAGFAWAAIPPWMRTPISARRERSQSAKR